MFDYFRKKKQPVGVYEEQMIKSDEDYVNEHEFKMEHDPEYRKSVEESAAFFRADREAREKAGLVNKAGSYTFICPNCGSECKGSWVHNNYIGGLHGQTDCFTCDIHLMV